MSLTTKALVLALLLSPAAAQHLRGSVGRRSLRESTPLDTFRAKGEADELTGRVQFKLNHQHPGVLTGRTSVLAEQVSESLACEGKAKRLFRPAGKHEASHVAAGLHLWYTVDCGHDDPTLDVHATSVRAAEKITEFIAMPDRMHDGVEIVEPEIVHKMMFEADDPLRLEQTHYDVIDLQDAWDITTGEKHVVVQVLDSGVDTSHEDFQYNIWKNPDEICGNGIDDDNNGYVDDCHGWNHADGNNDYLGSGDHGSHCAGTIAADSKNGKGVAGVAGGDGTVDEDGRGRKGVQLMISVGFGKTDVDGFDEALVYGADNGAQISSNSWGYNIKDYMPNSERDAIDYYNSKNGVVVFAAGNYQSEDNYFPGAYDGVVAVASLDNYGQRSWFSNFGSWVDIAAPGQPVLSTGIGNNYVWKQGTSMACPHVAGVLALGLSANPSISKDEMLDCLYRTAGFVDDVNPDYVGKLGAGMTNAGAFVRCCASTEQPTMSFEPTERPTPQPTLQPTFSLAPTAKCDCDQVLELELKTDSFASETSWALDASDDLKEGCVDASDTGGGFTQNHFNYFIELATDICAEQTYTFRITDSYGDGICCGWTGKGSYKLLLNGVVIKSGGQFRFEDSHTFTAPVLTAEPTFKPSLKPTGFPTALPTTAEPTEKPTADPTASPTATASPTVETPPADPTAAPSPEPSAAEAPEPTGQPTQSRCDALAPLRDEWQHRKKGCDWAEAKPWRCSKTGYRRMTAAEACTECGSTRATSLDWRKWVQNPEKNCAWAANKKKCHNKGYIFPVIPATDACCNCPV